jgi:quinol-cytochrome oxidoreductase complex cytochrome b subunit
MSWLDERIGGAALSELIREKSVPVHRHTVWYYFGGMTLFLFSIQVVTGILLLLYYRPTAESAFESVQFVMAKVQFGWLIRSLHSWSANLMILTLFIHMASVYLTRAYTKPREITWLTGVGLLVLVLGFGFSGYLLPWNKLAFFATQVGTQIVGSVPVAGLFFLRFLRGGDNVTGATLTRFYGFHVAVLPALTTALLTVHVLLVQLHGMSTPENYNSGRKMPFFPNFLLRDAVGWLVALGVLAGLAAMFPWELGEKADPFASAPKGIRPEWFFMWMFQTLKIVPAHVWIFEGERVAILGFGLLLLLITVVPLLKIQSRLLTILGWALLLYVFFMTLSGYFEKPVFAAGPEDYESDIHNQRGITCLDCHGTNTQPKKSEIAAMCAKCHSDLNYMRRFNPQMRVDQFSEYQTSVHGMRNAHGDENVATCTSCHSVHDIRSVRDPKSPVYRTQIASTCAKCHADPMRMASYKIPTDQFAKYSKSVHAASLLERHDLGAPTCNDCHGNHGARPPGLDSVASVCGQCHRQEKDLFGKSPHAASFNQMGLAGCIVCHENHEIKKTDDRMLSVQGDGVCSACHSGSDVEPKIQKMQLSILNLRLQMDRASEVLGRAERAGMEVSQPKFDLSQVNAELVKSRVSVHSFNPDKMAEVSTPAMTMVAGVKKAGNAALEDLAFRRRGLGYALIGIGIMIVALVLKIRELEK